jgi:hypothetical protein
MGFRADLFILTMALAPLPGIAGVELFIAPLVIQDDSGSAAAVGLHPEADLLRDLAEAAHDVLAVRPTVELPDAPVQTFLDATLLCQRQGYGFLLYGYVKRSEFSVSAEVKLLDSEKNEVTANFFNSDDRNHYLRLMHDLAARIVDYFYNDAGLKPVVRKSSPRHDLLAFAFSLGYWTPSGNEWGPVLAGLGSVSTGISFIPSLPLFLLMSREWYVSLGAGVEYGLGMNQPGHESFFLHSTKLRFPVELHVQLGDDHAFGLGAGPLFQVDTMVQDRMYDSPFIAATAVSGVTISAQYHYAASPLFSLGLAAVADIAFYAHPLVTISPRLFLLFMPQRAQGNHL